MFDNCFGEPPVCDMCETSISCERVCKTKSYLCEPCGKVVKSVCDKYQKAKDAKNKM